MSLSINKKNKKSTKLSSSSSLLTNSNANATITAVSGTVAANPLTRKRAVFNQHQYHHHQQQQQYKRKPKITKTTSKISSSLIALTPALQATSNINVGDTLFSTLLEQPNKELTQSTTITASERGSSAEVKSSAAVKVDHKIFRTTAMPSFKIMSYQNIIALLTVLVCGLVTVNGLKCYMCGQYNEGVGSITPCLNYSEQYAHLYLKECSKKSEKYCVIPVKNYLPL
ncbi:hypothetical protein DOY81_000610 [Sarcophaga bullata]|nr:hypothetical protein DOY81_000610 [Sarcophaga bullata]